MALIAWNDTLLIGVETIDRQHRQLVDILNRLHDALQHGVQPRDITRALSDVKGYTQYHFSAEERLMQESAYPELEAHIQLHRAFQTKLAQLEADATGGKVMVNIRLLLLLKDWLAHHILEPDKDFGVFYARRTAA
jgi:hemerythrin-like metal-binding protein